MLTGHLHECFVVECHIQIHVSKEHVLTRALSQHDQIVGVSVAVILSHRNVA